MFSGSALLIMMTLFAAQSVDAQELDGNLGHVDGDDRQPFGDARGQHIVLPGIRGDLEAIELVDDARQSFHPLRLLIGSEVLPVQEEAHEVSGADRLDLGAQLVERVTMDAGE